MIRDDVSNAYFEWLFDLVCGKRYSNRTSYRKLLMHLHNKEFRYLLLRDENRAEDGVDLRYRFSYIHNIDDVELYLDGPCSVLEMMVALAIKCERDIMDDPNVGDRTTQWFWYMITNLGLGSMSDDRFDKVFVDGVIECFLDRDYEPNGRGGLFTIRNCNCDLRTVEIWHQLLWYLDSIT